MNLNRFKESNRLALMGMKDVLPIIFGVLLLVSIINVLIPKSFYGSLFNGSLFRDSVVGATLGSVLTGSAVVGYLIGKGFLDVGVSLLAVTSFITAWTTVGLIQVPVESLILGKRFAVFRNITAFFTSIFVAIFTIIIINLI